MWTYNKVLEYPINIKCTDPRLAKVIISQYGGPDGELAASLRYLSQRFGMPDQKSKAILNDIGTEELAHLEMVGTIVHQLTKDASIEEIEKAGLGAYYTDHGVDVYPSSAAGVPFTASYDAVMIRIPFYLLFIFENTSFKFMFLLASNSILSINLLNTCFVIFSVFKNSLDSFLI